MEWVKLGFPSHPHNTWLGYLSSRDASKNPKAFCGRPTQTQDGLIDKNTALLQSFSILTSLSCSPGLAGFWDLGYTKSAASLSDCEPGHRHYPGKVPQSSASVPPPTLALLSPTSHQLHLIHRQDDRGF